MSEDVENYDRKDENCFTKEPVNLGRQKELDIAKGMAIIFMVFCHSFEILSSFFDPEISTEFAYVILDVHNEKSKQDKDYVKYVLIDNAGNKFVTGSESFFTSFKDIFDTMAAEAPGEEYSIDVLKKPSQNYKGKSFITCALAL
jgi:hypothetical protein